MAKKKTTRKKAAKKSLRKKISQGLATLALILNIIFPGIGSILGGKITTGVIQLILAIGVIFIFPFFVGILVWVAAVVWGIVTGVLLIKESQ